MSVTVSLSATSGRALTQNEWQKVEDKAKEVLKLEHDKGVLLNYLEEKMMMIAPNTAAINGTRVAAKLVAAAGGVQELAKIPACNI